MGLFQSARRLIRDQRGNAMIIGAAALPLMIGAAAIGVDTVQASLARRQLQRSADSAAVAGVYARTQGHSVEAAVARDLSLNNDVALRSSPLVENAPTIGAYAGNTEAVRVVLTADRAVPFMAFFTGSAMSISVEATAARVHQGEYCAIALERDVATGINLWGNSTVNLGCGMISNSRGASAVTAGGSATITASPVAAAGGIPSASNFGSGTVLLPFQTPQPDPYAAVPEPTVPGTCGNQQLRVQPTETVAISSSSPGYVSPGVYCWRGGIDIKGTVTFPPNSTIYVDGGDLNFGAQSVVNGNGVTFVLTSRNAATSPSQIAQLDINGGATLNLTAPDSGIYAGILFYQDRRTPYGTSQINGNSASFLRGGIYFPNRELVFNGTAGMQTACLQLVARRLAFTGNANISNACPSDSASQSFDATRVRLVG